MRARVRVRYGPLRLITVGAVKPSNGGGDKDFALVTRSVRVLLNKQGSDNLPASYEYIYRACRSVVDVYNRGEGLYETLKLELEKCVGILARELLQDKARDVERLLKFNETCAWFEKQTVWRTRIYAVMRAEPCCRPSCNRSSRTSTVYT